MPTAEIPITFLHSFSKLSGKLKPDAHKLTSRLTCCLSHFQLYTSFPIFSSSRLLLSHFLLSHLWQQQDRKGEAGRLGNVGQEVWSRKYDNSRNFGEKAGSEIQEMWKVGLYNSRNCGSKRGVKTWQQDVWARKCIKNPIVTENVTTECLKQERRSWKFRKSRPGSVKQEVWQQQEVWGKSVTTGCVRQEAKDRNCDEQSLRQEGNDRK